MRQIAILLMLVGLIMATVLQSRLTSSVSAETPPDTVLNHFWCWHGDGTIGIPDGTAVTLSDRFVANEERTFSATQPVDEFYCEPAKKVHDGETTEIVNADQRLAFYALTPIANEPARTVQVINQFSGQPQSLAVGKSVYLAAPAGFVSVPAGLDHFKCYEATGAAPSPATTVSLDTALRDEDVTIGSVQFFCTPVTKVHDGTTTPALLREANLVCYVAGSHRGAPVSSVTFRTQFPGATSLNLFSNSAELLCVPSVIVTDSDGDGVDDSADNCVNVANPDQADGDNDGIGNACDPDAAPPVTNSGCEGDGWKNYHEPRTFKNRGDCIKYVNSGK